MGFGERPPVRCGAALAEIGQSESTSSVPEPGMAAWMTIAGGRLLARRRGRSSV
jgi:hypothetical protein